MDYFNTVLFIIRPEIAKGISTNCYEVLSDDVTEQVIVTDKLLLQNIFLLR